MNFVAEFSLSFEGQESDDHQIDFYDVAQALRGFQRSLAITTHFLLNAEVITQVPSLDGARILALPPRDGSWEIVAAILGGIGYIGTRPKDTPLGHFVYSFYDYVVANTLGFHVDFNKSLLQSYEQAKKEAPDLLKLDESRVDAVIEKVEGAVAEMHRPIVKSRTATKAIIKAGVGGRTALAQPLTARTFAHVDETIVSEVEGRYSGWISSYNLNTFRGRIYLKEAKRPIPFVLEEAARTNSNVAKVSRSLASNARDRMSDDGKVTLVAFERLSRTRRLKSFLVIDLK